MKKLTSRGDTIVEVMIVLAILGLAMSISYATANRSLINARQAQESSEATELAKSQIEQIRGYALLSQTDPKSPYLTANGKFCYAAAARTTISGDINSYSAYPAACKSINRYHIAVVRSGSTNNFQVTVIWDDVTGNGRNKVTMNYKAPR